MDNEVRIEVGSTAIEHKVVVPAEVFGGNLQIDIAKLPDIDGRAVVLPRLVMAIQEGEGEMDVTKEERERLEYCLITLKLPLIVAVDLTFNRPEDLEKYVIPEGDLVPTVVSIWGEAGAGKTTTTARLVSELGAVAIDMDCMSDGKEIKTMRGSLKAFDAVLMKGERPALIVCDMPGYKPQGRPVDIFDGFVDCTDNSLHMDVDSREIEITLQKWKEELEQSQGIAEIFREKFLEGLEKLS